MKVTEITDAEALEKYKQRKLKSMQLRKSNPTPFDNTTTDMPLYDQMLADPNWARESQGFEYKVTNMSPKEYIRKCAEGFKSSVSTLEQQRTESGKVDKYADLLLAGTTFPMLVLVYTLSGHFSQEGLHRAFAALKAGFASVPVMVINEVD